MSDHFADQNNAKHHQLSSNSPEYYQRQLNARYNKELRGSYDHMYASQHANGLTDKPSGSCQNIESEVNFLKEFLLIHLDLIQQQNDDILNKDNTISHLQREIVRLREKISGLEKELDSQATLNFNNIKPSVSGSESAVEKMTLDAIICNNKDNVQIAEDAIKVAQMPGQIAKDNQTEASVKKFPVQNDIGSTIVLKVESEDTISTHQNEEITALPDYNNTSYTIHANSVNSDDPMKNLKMSIRRKRLCSTSSAISNNGSTSDEKRAFRRRSRKKRNLLVKNDQILTCEQQYVTQVGEESLDILRRQELAEEVARAASTSNLEVPRWRVKVYTSCCTMEGTENLEDEVYLRRHSRLENDERRRKRWDVQRIREQRLIDKLKQRQDKLDLNKSGSEQPECIESLWPSADEIKYIELSDTLPVSAFGSPVPKVQPSVFSLPWLTNPNIKKPCIRQSTSSLARRVNRRETSKS